MKKTKEKRSKYVRVKRWTPFKGVLVTLILQLILMIPILNIFIMKDLYEQGEKSDFWKGAWYDYVYVKEEI